MNMLRNLAQAKAPQRLAPSQGMLAFSPAETRPFLHHKSAEPHHRRGILRLSGRQRRNSAEVGSRRDEVLSVRHDAEIEPALLCCSTKMRSQDKVPDSSIG